MKPAMAITPGSPLSIASASRASRTAVAPSSSRAVVQPCNSRCS
jgi:hypothetical protein